MRGARSELRLKNLLRMVVLNEHHMVVRTFVGSVQIFEIFVCFESTDSD